MLPRIRKLAIAGILICGLCGIVILEELFRQSRGGDISVAGLPIDGVQVQAKWHPDFLWTGRAWSIQIQTTKDLRLQLDHRSYLIPPGTHHLYSNHDSTNTATYGSSAFWGYPKGVSIALQPQQRKD